MGGWVWAAEADRVADRRSPLTRRAPSGLASAGTCTTCSNTSSTCSSTSRCVHPPALWLTRQCRRQCTAGHATDTHTHTRHVYRARRTRILPSALTALSSRPSSHSCRSCHRRTSLSWGAGDIPSDSAGAGATGARREDQQDVPWGEDLLDDPLQAAVVQKRAPLWHRARAVLGAGSVDGALLDSLQPLSQPRPFPPAHLSPGSLSPQLGRSPGGHPAQKKFHAVWS